jgi:hypothetical protein
MGEFKRWDRVIRALPPDDVKDDGTWGDVGKEYTVNSCSGSCLKIFDIKAFCSTEKFRLSPNKTSLLEKLLRGDDDDL